MANEYIVASSDGDLFVTDISGVSANTSFYCALEDIDGSYSNPNPKWERTGMYLRLYVTGSNAYAEYLPFGSTTQTTSLSSLYPYIVLSAYNVMENNVKMLKIAWATGSNMQEAIQNIQGGYGMLLYSDTMDNATSGGIASVYDNHWEDPTDPAYDPGSSQGGGEADLGEIESDSIDNFPEVPYDPEETATHTDCRMMQPYLMSYSQVSYLGELFWKDADSDTSFFSKLTKILSSGTQAPMQSIAGLIRLPLPFSSISTDGPHAIYLGGIIVESNPGGTPSYNVAGHWIKSRWCKFAYKIQLKEVFGTDFDYTKTRIHLYLPYIAQVELDASEVMNGTLYAQYVVDVYTGDLLCTLYVIKTAYGKTLASVIARYKGNCALPMFYSIGDTQANTQNIFNGLFALGSSLGAIATGNPLGALSGLQTMSNMATDQRIHVQKGGSVSGASGWCDVQYPYLIIERQVPLYAEDWRKIKGASQWATFTVSALSGFTKFDSIHVEIPSASEEEANEIESILTTGIIL